MQHIQGELQAPSSTDRFSVRGRAGPGRAEAGHRDLRSAARGPAGRRRPPVAVAYSSRRVCSADTSPACGVLSGAPFVVLRAGESSDAPVTLGTRHAEHPDPDMHEAERLARRAFIAECKVREAAAQRDLERLDASSDEDFDEEAETARALQALDADVRLLREWRKHLGVASEPRASRRCPPARRSARVRPRSGLLVRPRAARSTVCRSRPARRPSSTRAGPDDEPGPADLASRRPSAVVGR